MLIWESSPLAEQHTFRCCICLASLNESDIAATRHHRAYCALCAPLCPPADWPAHFRSIADAPPRQRRLFAERREAARYTPRRADLRLVPPVAPATCEECGRELGDQPGPLCLRCQAIANREHYERVAALPGMCQGCGEETLTYQGFGLCCKG
jgi:hypothetical protein